MLLPGILFFTMACLAKSQVSPGVEELPLTELDIQLAQTSTAPAISIKSRKNQTCLLTQRYVPASSSGCTWRTIRKCTNKPINKKIPVYDAGCLVDDKGVHSKDCKVRMILE